MALLSRKAGGRHVKWIEDRVEHLLSSYTHGPDRIYSAEMALTRDGEITGFRVKVLDEWPEQSNPTTIDLRGAKYDKLYQYGSEVAYAAGAFNWRVAVGDRTRIIDYGREGQKLTAESSDTEIVWSAANQVSEAQVKQWFNKTATPASLARDVKPEVDAGDLAGLKRASIIASVILAVINLPIALASDDEDILAMLIGMGVLWIPFWLRNKFANGHSSDDSDSNGDD